MVISEFETRTLAPTPDHQARDTTVGQQKGSKRELQGQPPRLVLAVVFITLGILS